jgi:hypothetical protein
MITGSSFIASRLPQNLEPGQSVGGHSTILAVYTQPRKCGKDDSQTRKQFWLSVTLNDDLTSASSGAG